MVQNIMLSILLAEDDGQNRAVLSILIGQIGHYCQATANGPEAIDHFKKSRFDLVIMNLSMPGMSGKEAAGHIRAYEKESNLRQTPIVGITARRETEALRDLYAVGMNGCIYKPCTYESMRDFFDSREWLIPHHI